MDELEESAVTPEQRRRRKRRLDLGPGCRGSADRAGDNAAADQCEPAAEADCDQHEPEPGAAGASGQRDAERSAGAGVYAAKNLVVDEDPAFVGRKLVFSAYTVRANLRASSLWRRQVEFGTIHFDQPSVNLVRRADGRWNLRYYPAACGAGRRAPDSQTNPGPAPRFPYIEATGARLNVKLGEDEKMAAALTEADFALWLPSPQQWRVRIEAKPARTDMNVSETGILSVEARRWRRRRGWKMFRSN